jgi:pimeloyl-ACP methyl ester carboxylesterase
MVSFALPAETAPVLMRFEGDHMQNLDMRKPSWAPTLMLVHGNWHDGRCWSDVQKLLAAAGVHSIAPTLPGHGAGVGRLEVRHADYVSSIIGALDAFARPAVLVGHSFGGSVVSRVADLRPERCQGLVYYSAFVPRDGERVADSLPAQFIEFLEAAAASSADRTVTLPDELLREAFANTADHGTLKRIRSLLVPEPYAPIFETLSLPCFANLKIPAAYISCRDDRSLPPGTFHPGQSSRLCASKRIEIDGDHESLLTAPERLAAALLEALDALDCNPSQPAPVARG